MAENDDFEWEPPSEAQVKILQARRERSDQISKIMGDYLLKGYKMLGSVCQQCETILLQDKQGVNYCIACNELDSDTTKDDPALSHEAALRHEEEHSQRTNNPPHLQTTDIGELSSCETHQLTYTPLSLSQSNNPHIPQPPDNSSPDDAAPLLTNTRPVVVTLNTDQKEGIDEIDEVKAAVRKKLLWAKQRLDESDSVEYSTLLCRLIKESTEALLALQQLR